VVECRAYKLTFAEKPLTPDEENPLNPNHSLFGRVTITLFDGEHVFIVRRNQVDSNSTYKTYVGHRSDNRNMKDTGIRDTDMLITVSENKATGIFMIHNRAYILESCTEKYFNGCHVLKKIDQRVKQSNDDVIELDSSSLARSQVSNVNCLARGKNDTTTLATISIKFYFTEEFAKFTEPAAIPLQIQHFVEQANQGFINTNLPIRVKALRPNGELATGFQEIQNISNSNNATLQDFMAWVGKDTGSADLAVLIVMSMGQYPFDKYGNTLLVERFGTQATDEEDFTAGRFSVLTKHGAFKRIQLGHLIGHAFGADHDRLNHVKPHNNSTYNAYGWCIDMLYTNWLPNPPLPPPVIECMKLSTEGRYGRFGSIMANTYTNEIYNYYSTRFKNPDYPKADVAQLMMNRRFCMEDLGDESEEEGFVSVNRRRCSPE